MCLTTTCELQCMTTDMAPTALAKSRTKRTALYSASLLVIENWRWNAHSIVSPSGGYSRTPASSTRWLDEPFVHIIHVASLSSSSSFAINSAMKSAKAGSLIAILGQYQMSNSLSSIAHRTSRPLPLDCSLLSIMVCLFEPLWCVLRSTA